MKKRFVHIVLALIFAAAVAVGLGIWKTSQTPMSIENAEVSDSDFNLYTNERLGFSMLVPKEVDSWLYRSETLTYGIEHVPVKVFDDGKSNYIYISTVYEGSNDRDPIKQTFESIEKNKQPTGWKIVFDDVFNEADLIKVGKKYFGEGCGVVNKVPTLQLGVFDIELESTIENANLENDTCHFGYFKSVAKYSPDLNKLVTWSGGSDYGFILGSTPGYNADWSNVKVFDQAMIDSFRFIDKSIADTSDWKTYRNEEYGFEFKYPQGWEMFVTDSPDPEISVYKKTGENYTHTLHFKNATRVTILPKGFPAGGVSCSSWATSTVKLSDYNNIKASDCLLNDNNPFYTYIYFNQVPPRDSWGTSGFIEAQAVSQNLSRKCFINDEQVNLGQCGVGDSDPNAKTVWFGPVDESDIQLIKLILSTFKFIDKTSVNTSDWKTYRNEEYGFEFKYPTKLGGIKSADSQKEKLGCNSNAYNEVLLISFEHFTLQLACPTAIDFNPYQGYRGEKEKVLVAGRDGFYFDYVSSVGYHNKEVYIPLDENYLKIGHSFKWQDGYVELSEEDFKKIISTFKFFEVDTVQLDPVINNISPNKGPVGTVVVLKGKYLAGFEGDLDAWIENSAGEIAYLGQYGKSVYPETNQITAQITEKVCKTNESYRGDPCKEYMIIIPGTYKIYTRPWGVESNKVQFEVVK